MLCGRSLGHIMRRQAIVCPSDLFVQTSKKSYEKKIVVNVLSICVFSLALCIPTD